MIETLYFTLGDTKIYVYGLCIALAAVFFYILVSFFAKPLKKDKKLIVYFAAWTFLFAFLGSRIAYIIVNIYDYVEIYNSKWAFLKFWHGGYSMMGAIFGCLLGAWVFSYKNHVDFKSVMDASAIGGSVFMAIARLSENLILYIGRGKNVMTENMLLNSSFMIIEDFEGYGPFYAIFRIEALVSVLIFIIALSLFYNRKLAKLIMPGDISLLIGSIFGTIQVVLESLKDDGHMIIREFVRFNQIAAIIFPVTALTIFLGKDIKANGWTLRPIAIASILLAAIGISIYQEFQIDVTAHIIREYFIMSLAMLSIMLSVIFSWFKHRSQNIDLGG